MFTPTQFLDLGSRAAVDQALSRLAQAGTIRRLALGVYDYPKRHPMLGPLSPSADTVAKALVGRNKRPPLATITGPCGICICNNRPRSMIF